MRLPARVGLSLKSIVVLCFGILTSGALAQDQDKSQPKTSGPPQQAAPAPTGDANPPPPGWVVNCTSVQAGSDLSL
jgi:hypothetical protein